MSSLPNPDPVKAPPDDRNPDRAPIHPARELDRVFLDHYVARNLPNALPGIAGAVVGLRIFHRLTDPQFQRLVNVALIVSGVALALK